MPRWKVGCVDQELQPVGRKRAQAIKSGATRPGKRFPPRHSRAPPPHGATARAAKTSPPRHDATQDNGPHPSALGPPLDGEPDHVEHGHGPLAEYRGDEPESPEFTPHECISSHGRYLMASL